jgi:hypothetical protein
MRLLAVDRTACQQYVNDLRAQVGIDAELVGRTLLHKRALRTAVATALPLPRGSIWTALGWLRDVRSVAAEHAFSSACLAYLRDPYFFDRPAWASELLLVMKPAGPKSERAASAALVGSVVAFATARSVVRSLARRWGGGWIRTLMVRTGAGYAWGKLEAGVATRSLVKSLDRHLHEVVTEAKPSPREDAEVVAFPRLAEI